MSGDGDLQATSERLRELDLRLRQQVVQNAELDVELRYVRQELAIRNEFITALEGELASERALNADFAAYRDRLSHRIVDRTVSAVRRLPWLSRVLTQLRRPGHTRPSDPNGGSRPR
jgi:hypothetical protein